MFTFMEFNELEGTDIRLILKSREDADTNKGIVPRYEFSIIRKDDDADVGVVYFAVDTTPRQYLRGHLSYGVSPAWTGHGCGAKACMLIKQVAQAHGFNRLFVGAEHDNIASRKTIERLGAVPITVRDVPSAKIVDELQKQKISMYVWEIDVKRENGDENCQIRGSTLK